MHAPVLPGTDSHTVVLKPSSYLGSYSVTLPESRSTLALRLGGTRGVGRGVI